MRDNLANKAVVYEQKMQIRQAFIQFLKEFYEILNKYSSEFSEKVRSYGKFPGNFGTMA